MDPKIFGVSLLTIVIVVGAFYLGRKTRIGAGLPIVG